MLIRVHTVKAMFFSVVIHRCELDHKESWTPKNWCFQIVMLKKILESPLYFKEIKPVNTKGNISWIFIGRSVAQAEAPILEPRADSFEKAVMLGKFEGKKEKRAAEDEMVGEHHWLHGCEFEQTLGDNGGQRSLPCYGPWSQKELDRTQWLHINNDKGAKYQQ